MRRPKREKSGEFGGKFERLSLTLHCAPALTKTATVAGDKEYAGAPQNVQSVYNQISRFF